MESDVRAKNEKLNKIAKIVFKVLYQLLIIICVLLILIIFFQKLSDNNKTIFGYRIFRVITGSMEPEYEVGTVVISKEVKASDIKVGDDIVYLGKYGEYNGRIIMHQVIAIDEKDNGELNFHAAGLYNTSIEDPQISESQIYGVVRFQSSILTLLYKLATSIYSAFIIITILVLNVFVSFRFSGKPLKKLQEVIDANEEDDEENEDEEYDEEDDDEEDDDDEDDDEDDIDNEDAW